MKTLLDLQREKREELTAQADAAIAAAEAESRNLTPEESEIVQRAAADVADLDTNIAANVALNRGRAQANTDLPVANVRVKSEPLTYVRSGGQHSHVRDHALVALNGRGAQEARERLERHAREVEV